jgi:hypothetical protein
MKKVIAILMFIVTLGFADTVPDSPPFRFNELQTPFSMGNVNLTFDDIYHYLSNVSTATSSGGNGATTLTDLSTGTVHQLPVTKIDTGVLPLGVTTQYSLNASTANYANTSGTTNGINSGSYLNDVKVSSAIFVTNSTSSTYSITSTSSSYATVAGSVLTGGLWINQDGYLQPYPQGLTDTLWEIVAGYLQLK